MKVFDTTGPSLGARLGRIACFAVLDLTAFAGCSNLWSQTTFPGKIGIEVSDRPTGFVDAFKDGGRLFIDSSGNPLPTDANGNPLSDGIAVVFDDRPTPEWLGYADDPSIYQPDMSGTYLVSFQGQATLSNVVGAPVLTFANQAYNAATNTTTVNVTLPGGPTFADGPALMEISFTNTQLTPTSGSNTGIAALQAIRPGFNASQIFDPAFMSAFAPFSHLRFMGWLGTNTSPGYYGDSGHNLLPWSSRSLPTDFYQGVGANTGTNTNIKAGAWGVSWEYVILLANATNKDIWINVPVSATGSSDSLDPAYVASPDSSSYIYNLAYLLKNGNAFTGNVGLNPGLHIYIEHSNEVWNWGYLQSTWNELAAADEVSKGGSALNNDGDTTELDWAYRRHIKRLYEIGQIFQSVFGAGSLNTTIRPVYAWWNLDEGSGSNAANALSWFNKTYGPPSNYFFAMAQADYFTASNYANDTTIPEVLSDMTTDSAASVQYVTAGKTTATQYGLKLFAYEGGPDNSNGGLQNTTNVGVQILANRDPGMDTLVQNHIRSNWFAQGGDDFGYFVLSSDYSRYGDYGATDDYRNLTTAKYNALVNLTGYTQAGVPFAPGNLVGIAGNQTVALSWEPVPGAANYNVKRGTTSGGETLLATVSSPTYSDTAVTNGITYYYVVTGVNTSGESAPSNEANATPVATAPPAPTLTATAGNGQATLTWTAPTGATSYNIYQGSTSGGESTTPIATGITLTSYTVQSLADGTPYYFEVAAVNSLGTGAISNEASVTPTGPPAAPTGLTATIGNGQAVLSWTASLGATSYNVYQGTASGGEGSTPVATGITAATYTVTGLTDGTEYFFTVAAVNTTGVSGPSNEATATPAALGALLAYEPFGEATGVLLGANGSGDFGWNAAWVNQSGNSDPTPGYNIVSTTPLAYPGLAENGNYLIGGEGYNYAGRQLNVSPTGPFASYLSSGLIGAPGQTVWLSFLIRKDTANTGTTNLVNLTAQGGGSAWYVSPGNVAAGFCGGNFGGGSTTGSTMYWSLIAGDNFSCSSAIQTNVPIVVGQPALMVMEITFGATNVVNLYVNPTSLGGSAPATPSATYSTTDSLAFQSLSYYGGDGTSESSLDEIRLGTSFAAVTPALAVAPPAPTGLTATAGNAQAVLNWTASAGATSYNVYQGTTSGGESTTPIATGVTGTSYTALSLANGTAYYFEVAAVNSSGTSAASNEASATPAAPLLAPTGLTATAGSGQVALSWTGSLGATSYNVYQGAASGGESATPVATGITATTYTVTGLTNGTVYFFKVAAVNTGGVSGYSNEATATPASGGSGSGTLLAYEPFGESTGALFGASGGGDSGWSAAWDEQSGSIAVPGYDVASTAPLTYTGLLTTPDYATGGYAYQSAGRELDVSSSGPFSSYLSSGVIGAPGQTIWLSFLFRVDASNIDTGAAFLNTSNIAWLYSASNNLGIGYFGGSSDTSGNPFWSLQFNGTTVQSTAPMVVGQPALLVVEDTFGANGQPDQINLFVNPISLGGAAPATPTLQYSPANSTAFQGIAYYGGNNTNMSSLADIRIGTSFAAVTPALAAAIPAAPTGLTATAGNGQAALSWTASSGAASYNVYEGTAPGGESSTPVATGITAATYTVTGLTNGTPYYFTVAAVSTGGVSGYSNEATATPSIEYSNPTPITVPNFSFELDQQANYIVPQDWTLTNTGASSVVQQISSNANNTPPFTDVDGTYYWSPGISNAGSAPYGSGTATLASAASLGTFAANAQYTLTVALGDAGYGSDPTVYQVGFQLLADGVPVANFVAPTSGANALPPTCDYCAATGLADYSLTYSTYGQPQIAGQNITVALVYTYTGPYLRSAYFDNVRLTQALEAGGSIPIAPTSLVATAGSGQVALSWTPVTGATSYNVYESTTSGGEGSTPVATGIDTSTYTVTKLTNGTTYYFVVTAVDSAGVSAVSNESSATPEASLGIPAAPTLTATSGDMTATLSWPAVPGASSYNVYQATASGGEGTTPIATGVTANTYLATGLTDETTYFFQVAAVNSYGTSALSKEATATPAPAVGGTNAPADFSIYPQVLAAQPFPAGFSIAPAAGTDIGENAWLADGGFNAYDARLSLTADQPGTSSTFICESAGGGTSFYQSISTGFFVGAIAHTYRYSSGAWALLRTDTVTGYAADGANPTAANGTITFANSGPPTQAGDIIWLDLDNQATLPNVSQLDPRFTTFDPTWSSETQGGETRTATWPYTLSPDVPSSDTGGLSLEITDTNTETQGIWQYIQGAFVGPADEEFQPGHTYAVDVWLKQSGVSNGNVSFTITEIGVSHTFTGVTSTWQEFNWTFAAPGGLAAGASQPTVRLDYSAPGTLWADNLQLYDTAWAPNTVSPQVMQAWTSYQPGTVRIWSNFSNSGGSYSYWGLDSWLAPEIKSHNNPGIGNQYAESVQLEHLPDALANVKTIGTANPWLIVNMALSEVEWGELIDYLAAPAGTGYASMRPASHPGPYTADFSTIYLEVGNEEWGTQRVPADTAYGQWAHFVLSNAIAGKSYFNASQIKFIVNGFELEPSFGSAAIAAAPEASFTEAALYSNGNTALTGDSYYQSDLVQLPVTNGPLINALVAQQQLDAAGGRTYGLAAYEEGPGSDTGDTTLAAAVGAIDINLYASQSGFGPQNFFLYNLGTGPWSSHSNFANGFRPHPVWEALQMRNNYASGPIVLTTTNSVPTYSDPTITSGQAVPLIAVYTFQDATVTNQADVVVISRDLNNETPVTLHFPATPTGSAQLYTLTGDPRASNDAALNIPIGSTTVSVTANYTFTMPPGSMYIFQVPMTGPWSSSGQPTPPPPASLSASAGNGEVTLTWPASSGATGYNVLRGTATGGPYTQIGSTSSVAYTDTPVTNGTTYYYVVEATNPGGASGNSPEVNATPNVEDDSSTAVPPPLDGSDTGAWANAPFVPMPHYFQGTTTDTAAYKTLWDSNYLYVLVSVQDGTLVAPTSGDIWTGDTVEVYFSGTDSKSTTYGPTDFQYAFPYGFPGGGAVVTEADHSPSSLTGVLFGQQNITGGYQMAMALPWTTLGTVPVLNQQYGFDVMIDDANVQGTRLGKLAWWGTADETWSNPSLMGPLVLTAGSQQPQTIIFPAPVSPVIYGVSPITLSATGGASGNPVVFTVDASSTGSGTISGNMLTITGVGTIVVDANQAGTSTYAAAAQVQQSIVVNPIGTVATPIFTPATGTYYGTATNVTLATTTAGSTIYYTVTAGNTGTTPTTSSTLYTSAGIPLATVGTSTIEAVAVEAGYTSSGVATASYTISTVAPSFTMAFSPASISIQAGLSGSIVVTVTPAGGFDSQVSFSCSGQPTGASCTFSPATVTPTGIAAVTTTLTIATSASGTVAMHRNSNPLFPGATLAVALCFLGWKKRRNQTLLLLLAISVIGLTLFIGCGGSSSTTPTQPITYLVNVTATPATGTAQTGILAVVVQ